MKIFDKHPLPWEAVTLPNGTPIVQDAKLEFIAVFETLAMAEWAVHAWMLAQGTDSDLVEEEDDEQI